MRAFASSASFAVPVTFRRCLIWLALVGAGAAYLAISAHTPRTLLPFATHDDGLFIKLAGYLAKGEWLGPFNHVTLSKGPGFPAFLALSSWLGLPFSIAQGLLHFCAVALTGSFLFRLTESRTIGAIGVALCLFHPVSLAAPLLRIHRDAIYGDQVLLFIAAFGYCVLVARNHSGRFLWAAGAGLLFAWVWYSREEGIWLLPAILLLPAVAWIRSRASDPRPVWTPLVPLFAFAIAAALVGGGILYANWKYYGSAIGVDIKERQFLHALRSLQGVRGGQPVPYVQVSREVREKIYRQSPSFASLQVFLDPPEGSSWQWACKYHPTTCGDIGAGWFMWALRDAAAETGHYSSPAEASRFFEQMGNEIDAACESGRLACSKPLFDYMPTITWPQLRQAVPRLTESAMLLMLRPILILDARQSEGTESELNTTLRLLNFPAFTLPEKIVFTANFRGWYYRSGGGWLQFRVDDEEGKPVNLELARRPSPDLASHFRDERAGMQRFEGTVRCRLDCALVVQSGDDGRRVVPLSFRFDSLIHRLESYTFDGGTIHFDAFDTSPPSTGLDARVEFARELRQGLSKIFSFLLPFLLGTGFLLFLIGVLSASMRRTAGTILAVAGVFWILVAARVAILVLIDISSFPAVNPQYLAPAYYLSAIAAILSLAAFWQGLPWYRAGERADVGELAPSK